MRPTALHRTKGHGQQLQRMLKRHGLPNVILVLEFWATSNDSRAEFYRDRDNSCTLTTMRRHFDELVDLAENPKRRRGEYAPKTAEWTAENERRKAIHLAMRGAK